MVPCPTARKKITFAETRDMGVRALLIYCSDYKCSHLITISGDRWADGVEAGFICAACGRRGADVRPDFNWNRKQVGVMGYR